MEKEIVFSTEHASFLYDEKFVALDDVNLTVKQGECVAILGANGSGKSTLLKLLDGLYFPTRGSVLALGSLLTEAAFQDEAFNYHYRRQVGFIFQDSDVQLFSPSVWDEIAFAPLHLGLPRNEVRQRVEAALESLEIEKLRDRVPHRLSGGEKKRVALASVLSLNPEIWLMDEPTTGLDPRTQAWLDDFIYAQAEMGKTLVIATHDLSLAASVANRAYLFDENHTIVAEGEPDELFQNHELLIACNLAPDHVHPQHYRNSEHTRQVLHMPFPTQFGKNQAGK